jgi:hypothetical protein
VSGAAFPDILTPDMACRYLKMGRNKLDRLTLLGVIPARDTNPEGQRRKWIYVKSELLKWAAGQGVPEVLPEVFPRCNTNRGKRRLSVANRG